MKNFQQKSVDTNQIDRTITPPSVTEYMVTKLITFKPDTPISEVIDSLLENRITGAPVLNEFNEIVGLIDDKDCLNVLFGGAYHNSPVPVSDGTVASYMSNVMKTISVNADIFEVANKFLTTPYKRLLVMDDNGKLVGQVSRRDILRAIKDMNAAH
jgi:CBS domain-containing protein